MKTPIGRKLSAGLLALAVVLAVPVYAAKHGGPGMMDGKGGPGSQQMSGMMHDMADQMIGMSGQMSKGNLSADMQKQMDQMRKQMDEMMKGSSTPAKKK